MDSRTAISQQQITFEDLPQAIGIVLTRLDQIVDILTTKGPESSLRAPVNTKDICKFLGVTEPTVIRYRKKGLIPFYMIGSAIRYDLEKVVTALENKKKQK